MAVHANKNINLNLGLRRAEAIVWFLAGEFEWDNKIVNSKTFNLKTMVLIKNYKCRNYFPELQMLKVIQLFCC